jgi:hypothetical protein
VEAAVEPEQLETVEAMPEWTIGAAWDYEVLTADTSGGDDLFAGTRSRSNLVRAVAAELDTSTRMYSLASDNLGDATEHAVVNLFPFFGRVAQDNCAVYEEGAPQNVFGVW